LDRSEPSAVVLAVWRGHADILRLLVQKWPDASRDEAFSLALVRQDAACLRVLGPAKFVWSPLVISLLHVLPSAALASVCRAHDLTLQAVSDFGEFAGSRVWAGVQSMLARRAATSGLILAVASRFHRTLLGKKWLREGSFWEALEALDLNPSHLFPDRANPSSKHAAFLPLLSRRSVEASDSS
jgi:hypothetical protein